MNERIKQLIEQSQKVVGYLDGGYTEIKALDPEKFALLIVRECAKRVDYWESRQGEHADDLLKHFGVEE
jgi:hypothetical protein